MSQQLIGQGVVEIVASSEGLEATLARAAVVAERGGQAVGKGISEGAAKASEGLERVSSAVQRYERSVEKEIAATELSRTGFRAWEAIVKKIPESVYAPLLQRLDEAQRARAQEAESLKAAARAEAEAAAARREAAAAEQRAAQTRESYLQGLRDKIALTARDTEAQERYRAVQAGAGAEAQHLITQLTNIRAAHAQAAEAAKQHAEAEQRAARVQADNAAFVTSLERQANAIGKTRSELLQQEAAQRGVSAAAEPYIAKLRAQEQALGQVSRATNAAGMSQKAYDAALRGVPAQITDIVVSLQGGQAPLTVLLQQGGQLKDMFNGIVPAFRALGSELLKLVANPVVLAVAGVAALAAAYYKGSQESTEFTKALALTGNRAGVTAGQLQEAARAMGEVTGTQGAAAEALTALVSEGGVRGLTDLTRYAETARDAQKYLGIEVKETAKAYADLAKDPLKASERLTEQMGYLTHAQYLQIKALVETGEKTEAVTVAQRAYDDAVRASAQQVTQSLGGMQRAWSDLKGVIDGVLDSIYQIGRAPTPQDTRADLEQRLGSARQFQKFFGSDKAVNELEAVRRGDDLKALREADNAMAAAEKQRLEDAKIAAQARVDVDDKARRSKAQIRKDEIAEMRRDYALLGRTEQQMAEAEKAINEKYKDSKGRTPRAYTNDAATKEEQRLKQSIATLKEQQQVEDNLTQAQKDRFAFLQQIEDIKTKKILTADEKSLAANEQSLRVLHDQNVAESLKNKWKIDQAKHDEEAVRKANEYLAAVQRVNNAIESRTDSRADAYDSLLTSAGRGDRGQQRAEEERRLRREFERDRLRLRNAADTTQQYGTLDSDLAAVQQKQDAALAQLRQFYAEEDRMRQDWRMGFNKALEDYYDSAQNVASRVENAMVQGLSAVEDAFVSLATTGKASFSDLANTIVAEIVRISVRMAMANALGGAGGGGGWLGSLLGMAFSYFTGGAGGGTAVNGSAINTVTGGGAIYAADGGYTGDGGKHDYAGVVHKGEVVWSQEDIRNAGGVGIVERMRRGRRAPGYANGGVVGGASVGGGSLVNITIQNNGTETEVQQQQNENGGIDLLIIAKKIEEMIGGNVQNGRGPVTSGIRNRFNLKG